jgi:hypothetical protein
MAGFDLLIEVSKETALELIKSNVYLGTTAANPPFEVTLPISSGPLSGLAHMMVNDMSLVLTGDAGITLTLAFANSSFIFEAPTAITASLLDGTIQVSAILELIDWTQMSHKKVLSTDLGKAVVALNFSKAAKARIMAALSGTPVSVATFTSLATSVLTSFVQGVGRQTIRDPNSLLYRVSRARSRAASSTGSNSTISPTRPSACSEC